MTKETESMRGFYDLQVLLALYELGRPAKEREIEEKTNFPMTSMALSKYAQRGYVDRDVDAHTWWINDAGRAHLLKVSDWELREYRAWEKSQQ